mgnify:CR=1 FL=1
MVQIWRHKFKYICGILALLLCLLTGCTGITDKSADQTDIDIQQTSGQEEQNTEAEQNAETLEESSKEDVAAYIHQFGHLPDNFITKKEAKNAGWVSSKGNLSEAAPGKSIGGDRFGNYEGILPEKEGRQYYECDIDSDGGYRGAKRIIYSDDGLVYYTEDHYETFELLYGEENP